MGELDHFIATNSGRGRFALLTRALFNIPVGDTAKKRKVGGCVGGGGGAEKGGVA